MSIEMGARGGMIALTKQRLIISMAVKKLQKLRPGKKSIGLLENAETDEGASSIWNTFDAADIEPMITYGTNPGMGIGISQHIPKAESLKGGKAL